MYNEDNLPRWYFGGIASAMATYFTHPLDLVKVQLQTQRVKVPVVPLTARIIKNNGLRGLYSGLSASLLRQLTYSTARFAIYDTAKAFIGQNSTVMTRIFIAGFAGTVGGFIGTPSDIVNVRMQNDSQLAPDKRFRYKNVIHGFQKIYRGEGFSQLFAGGFAASVRAGVMGIGQLVSYDVIKNMLISSTCSFGDSFITHFCSSLGAGMVATTLTQPLDVIKTRLMSAKFEEKKTVTNIIFATIKEGPIGFYKGYIPAFLRVAPHTVLTFLFYEQLRLYFGYIPQPK